MKLWQTLYAMIWLAFLEILLVLDPLEDISGAIFAHFFLGVIIIVLAIYNKRSLDASEAPARIKRIGNAILGMAIAAMFLGFFVYLQFMGLGRVIHFLHVIVTLAILAQASSAATGYDMWEEKECDKPSSK